MTAVILAAGYATRLYPLTLNTPKCLLTVGGRTLLDKLCDELDGLKNLRQTVIVTNAKFFDQIEAWRKIRRLKKPLRILNDQTLSNETRLGAIGDLDFVLKNAGVSDDVLMLASDNWFDGDLNVFVRFCQSQKNRACVGLYDLKDPNLAAGKFGVVQTAPDGRVTGLEEKPAAPKSAVIGMGIYYFPKESLGRVREYLKDTQAKDAPGHYIRWLLDREPIFGFLFSGVWYDIGDLSALKEADDRLKAK
jgi:glucose-1-phosphate thymidylyltransferase